MNDMRDSLSVDRLLTDLEQMQDRIEMYQNQNMKLKQENVELMLQKNKLEKNMESLGEQCRRDMANLRMRLREEAERQIKQDRQAYLYRERVALDQAREEKANAKASEEKARRNIFFCLCVLAFLVAYLITDMIPMRPSFAPTYLESLLFWWMVFGLVLTFVYLIVLERKG